MAIHSTIRGEKYEARATKKRESDYDFLALVIGGSALLLGGAVTLLFVKCSPFYSDGMQRLWQREPANATLVCGAFSLVAFVLAWLFTAEMRWSSCWGAAVAPWTVLLLLLTGIAWAFPADSNFI